MTSSLRTKIKRYDSLDEMKADEYRYWQQQPDHEYRSCYCGQEMDGTLDRADTSGQGAPCVRGTLPMPL